MPLNQAQKIPQARLNPAEQKWSSSHAFERAATLEAKKRGGLCQCSDSFSRLTTLVASSEMCEVSMCHFNRGSLSMKACMQSLFHSRVQQVQTVNTQSMSNEWVASKPFKAPN